MCALQDLFGNLPVTGWEASIQMSLMASIISLGEMEYMLSVIIKLQYLQCCTVHRLKFCRNEKSLVQYQSMDTILRRKSKVPVFKSI